MGVVEAVPARRAAVGAAGSQTRENAPAAATAADLVPMERALRAMTQDRRSEATRRAYGADLRDFFLWWSRHGGMPRTPEGQAICSSGPGPAEVAALCRLEAGELAAVLQAYQGDLVARKLSEATANRRLSAVRSLLRLARRLGAGNPDPAGLVLSETVRSYRDTRGVTPADVKKLLAAPDRGTLKGKRDYALLLLLWENALRRAEISACDVGDFDAAGRRLYIKGKGRGLQKEPVTLSERACQAVADYLRARDASAEGAPLFANRARWARGEMRLMGDGIYDVVQSYGKAVLGRALRPHQLRHTAITAVLDATGGDVRTAQRLSRHADIRTLQRYDDNREDLQGRATDLLSALA